jgi:hypothetical protein
MAGLVPAIHGREAVSVIGGRLGRHLDSLAQLTVESLPP